ncbi:MAG: ABC transporter ATP-binding protein [Christensenellaceae bacterium]|nr:ABC transporter ATP-binding protein [Christensenellaceae bacterium]
MIKKLAGSIRQYKKEGIMTPLFVALESVIEVLIPFFMAKLIDNGIEMGDMSYIIKMALWLLILTVCAGTFGILAGKTATAGSAGFAKNLRSDMYNHIQTYSFSNIDKFSTTSLVTRLTSDVNNVQMAYQMLTRMAIRSPSMLIFSSVMAFSIDAKISMIFLIFVPLLCGGLMFITLKAHPKFKKVFRTYDDLNLVVQENVRGIRVVKTFNREENEEKKFKGISQTIYELFTSAEKIVAFNSPIMQFSMYSCTILICWLGANAIVASGNNAALGLTTGQLMSLLSYSGQILMSFMMVSMLFVMTTMARASGERICEVLDEQSDITSPENAVTEVKDGSIRFDHVDFSYSRNADKLCLDDIDFEIRSGETVGIIGATGSSKSTLVQLIPRLYDPVKGSVMVGGRDVRKYDIKVLRDAVAMVLQKNVLFSGTIKENLRWGKADATDEEIRHVCDLACASEFIEGFPEGYDTFIEQGGSNVSGGQKQRLCIARALLKKPKILILDDSTSAVDTKTDAMIRKAFREEIPDTTKLIIAQRISSVMDADKIIIMDDGKIMAFGSHEELMATSDVYREIYESQTNGGAADEQK